MKRTIIALFCFFAAVAIAVPAVADRDYDGHRGYRERPYDQHRHYEHYSYRGHEYNYRGHWRSWNDWDDYAREHPRIYEHGRYYRDQGHLMFRFCEPGRETVSTSQLAGNVFRFDCLITFAAFGGSCDFSQKGGSDRPRVFTLPFRLGFESPRILTAFVSPLKFFGNRLIEISVDTRFIIDIETVSDI